MSGLERKRGHLSLTLFILSAVVLALTVVALPLLWRVVGGRTDRQPATTGTTTAVSAEAAVAVGTDQLPGKGSFEDPYIFPLAAGGRMTFPPAPSGESYRLLAFLKDGRAVLLHRQSLVLAKASPALGEPLASAAKPAITSTAQKQKTAPDREVVWQVERVLAEAPYGVQAAADDRYLVWGVGGDEVWQLYCYDVETDETKLLATDQLGFYGLAILPDHRFYTTRIDYDNMLKIPRAYVQFDLTTGRAEETPAAESRLDAALDLLASRTGREPGAWHYEVGTTWSEAYVNGAGDLFELQIAYADLAADLYDYQLFKIAVDGTETQIAAARRAPRPELLTAQDSLSCGSKWFYEGAWYQTQERLLPLYYQNAHPYFAKNK